MTNSIPETKYTIGFDYFSLMKVYKIKGENGAKYTFDHGMLSSAKLKDPSGNTLIKFYISNPIIGYYDLEFKGFQTNLNSVRFENHLLTGYTIVGNYGNQPFNWEWKCESLGYKHTLVDKTNGGQTLAKINDTVFSLSKEGSVLVAAGVPDDFHKVIVATAAFIWKKKSDRS
ncbi:hypothetical protein CONCODRAFT_80395 [Conidiobolus coronatus NRRL 28638]|uniref:Tubby C-terminal domain-containing protein n=1 Tax=Conidiobolus coronatus (strain ATCC 28846 / CBS 209.66 / NRRL 28638) TaxID=796925 RepID=A0A137NVT6_CONC2|nr:hypothetical protein CONCODRAFT_80395 [Conidiobolus coronatus NRRL 28638]|eukprot:KXN66788.1 hypothetical protein CONCODRAFT_80395 [Conidiobolus coronatus NRRL 28638]